MLSVRVEPVAGDLQPWTFRIGTGDSWQGISIHYARREGANASFVIAQSKVRSLIDALY